MNSTAADSRNRRAVSSSVMAGGLQALLPILRQGQAQHVLGKGMNFTLEALENLAVELNTVNTYGSDADRDLAAMRASVDKSDPETPVAGDDRSR